MTSTPYYDYLYRLTPRSHRDELAGGSTYESNANPAQNNAVSISNKFFLVPFVVAVVDVCCCCCCCCRHCCPYYSSPRHFLVLENQS